MLCFFGMFSSRMLPFIGFLSNCTENKEFHLKKGENCKFYVGTLRVDKTPNWVYWVIRCSNQGKIEHLFLMFFVTFIAYLVVFSLFIYIIKNTFLKG